MSDYEWLEVRDDGGIVTVEIARKQARNALDGPLMRELTKFARDYQTRPDVRAVILTGGAEFFSAGADLGGVGGKKGERRKPTMMEMREMVRLGPDMCRAWEEMEPITICAIEGFCIGGGAALVVATDFRIMAEDSYLRLPEVPLGINMSWQTLPRLTALVGPSKAKQFTIFGEKTFAVTCLEWGLADEVAPKGHAFEAAQKWARKVAALPPLPVRMSKEAINAAASVTSYASTFMDRDQYLLTFQTEDFKEGVQAFFEKRDGDFKGN